MGLWDTYLRHVTDRLRLSQTQLRSMLEEASRFRERIGAIALKLGLLSVGDAEVILHRARESERFGEAAVRLGYMRSSDVDLLLRMQEFQDALDFSGRLVLAGLMEADRALAVLAHAGAVACGGARQDALTT